VWLPVALGIVALGLIIRPFAVGSAARSEAPPQDTAATPIVSPSARTDDTLLFIGDSITTRGREPLETALAAAGWDATVDGLGGRPLMSGARDDWTPLCDGTPGCGADQVLAGTDVPGTVVLAVGTNAFNLEYRKVAEPTATSTGLSPRTDAEGRYVVAGQDSPEDFARAVDAIMALVPETTRVYWVGYWLDDRLWGNVPWRENNTAIQAAVTRHPNATFLDYAAFVERESLPHMNDGSHPTPDGMILRARWIADRLA
jgi:hypothetical protein